MTRAALDITAIVLMLFCAGAFQSSLGTNRLLDASRASPTADPYLPAKLLGMRKGERLTVKAVDAYE